MREHLNFPYEWHHNEVVIDLDVDLPVDVDADEVVDVVDEWLLMGQWLVACDVYTDMASGRSADMSNGQFDYLADDVSSDVLGDVAVH